MSEADKIIEQIKSLDSPKDSKCDICKDHGFFLNKDKKATQCQCRRTKLLHKLYSAAQIPSTYYNLTMLDHWDCNVDAFGKELGIRQIQKIRVKEFINQYIRVLPVLCGGEKAHVTYKSGRNIEFKSLAISGDVSSGKTMIVSILAQQVIKNGGSSCFYKWHDLSSTLTEFRNSDSMEEVNENFKNYDFIVIDGATDEYNLDSPTFFFNIDRISASRISCGKPIAITCSKDYVENIYKPRNENKVAAIWAQLFKSCFLVELP